MLEAQKDLDKLDNSQYIQVLKAIKKVSENPLPADEGGLGKPPGSNNKTNLSGYLKIKLRDLGIRVVYKLVVKDDVMLIVKIQYYIDLERLSSNPLYTKIKRCSELCAINKMGSSGNGSICPCAQNNNGK